MANGRLLILDDDADLGELTLDIARLAGIEARYTADPDEFFSLIAGWMPTHLFIDLKMPRMDGVEVIIRLAARHFDGALIIASGVGERVLDAAARSALEHGLNLVGSLSKPFSPRELGSLLQATPAPHHPLPQPASEAFQVTREELERALALRQIHAYFQPKVTCSTGRLVGFEALARWIHPVHGLIVPDRFIPLAEESGLVDELTRQMIEQTLELLADTHAGSLALLTAKPLKISVNMSARTLHQLEFVEQALAACTAHGISPRQLVFELTESSAMENPVDALAMLTRLRVKDFELSIDDFGTGYSSLRQLVQLPFSEIKIDKSFVMALEGSDESRKVVKSIVSLGQSLGLATVAEGVETESSLNYLRAIGCEIAQGYLISRPLSDAELRCWIGSNCQDGRWSGESH